MHSHSSGPLPLPQLHYLDVKGRETVYTHPLTLVGHIVAIDARWVSIHEGRERVTQVSIDDLAPVFGDRDLMVSLFFDAKEHGDLIHLSLSVDRIAYVNLVQLQRFIDAPR
jgi:hypothetical protein